MSALVARGQAKEIFQEIRISRCGCGNPDSHSGRMGGPVGECPKPLPFNPRRDLRENYWHRNPFRRLAFALKKAWRESSQLY